ncbi:hypothetical protein GCM10017673_10320 [Streptosporangium violaceochromogenes]|nr:hypothetical protein GCM10017673_10320 [Streptosporangium violaceochromogenes]
MFQGILFVLHTGIAWEHPPQELGFGSVHRFRRLRIRWEIRDDIHEAFLALGRALICRRRLNSR